LTSSLSSVLGGLGYGAYAAANAFMDAFTRYRNARGVANWISVNWDEWRLSDGAGDDASRGLAQFALTPLEGGEAFARILSLRGAGEVVVSTGDLQARINQWIKLEGLRESATQAAERKPATTRYPRPNLQNAYVAPGTPIEQKIAEVWQDLLGIEQVGIHDNFFELGGHSMLGIQLVARIKTQLKANISIATLFEGPTVESLARIVSEREGGDQQTFDSSRDRGQRRKERSRERSQRQADLAAGAVAGIGGGGLDGGVDLR
jgi:acyl carrier protein